MGLNSLYDLKLAGIKWELMEKPIPSIQIKTEKNTMSLNHNDAIIPAIKPVAVASADNASKAASNLLELSDAIKNFNHPLRQFATNTVLPHFTKSENLLIITDMPSNDDDVSGKILNGGAGELFDKMLSAIGLSRENISIIPLVFWRTPGGRTPARDELDLAKPFVKQAIHFLRPAAIMTLGTLAATEIINVNLAKHHGEIIQNDTGIPVVPIYHPNYLMLKPDTKKDVWNALQKLQNLLKTA